MAPTPKVGGAPGLGLFKKPLFSFHSIDLLLSDICLVAFETSTELSVCVKGEGGGIHGLNNLDGGLDLARREQKLDTKQAHTE